MSKNKNFIFANFAPKTINYLNLYVDNYSYSCYFGSIVC